MLNVCGWPVTAPENHFWSAAATVENAWNLLAQCGTVTIHRKTQTIAPETALKHYHWL